MRANAFTHPDNFPGSTFSTKAAIAGSATMAVAVGAAENWLLAGPGRRRLSGAGKLGVVFIGEPLTTAWRGRVREAAEIERPRPWNAALILAAFAPPLRAASAATRPLAKSETGALSATSSNISTYS